MANYREFLDDDMQWKCTKCGACCRMVRVALPEFDRGDGACKHLTEENTCAIYEDRPKLCRVTRGNDADRAVACATVYNMVYG